MSLTQGSGFCPQLIDVLGRWEIMFKFFLHFRWHGIFLPPASIFFWST